MGTCLSCLKKRGGCDKSLMGAAMYGIHELHEEGYGHSRSGGIDSGEVWVPTRTLKGPANGNIPELHEESPGHSSS